MKKATINSALIMLACALPVFAYGQGVTGSSTSIMTSDNMRNTLLHDISQPDNAYLLSSITEEDEEGLSCQTFVSVLKNEDMHNHGISDRKMDPDNGSAVSVIPSQGNNAFMQNMLLVQADNEELSHQALTTVIQSSDMFYFVSASGTLPVLDRTFRDFIDYGATVNFGVGKRVSENISITATVGVAMLTGEWSISGDRKSIEIAAEEWIPGYTPPGEDPGYTPPAEDTGGEITAEDIEYINEEIFSEDLGTSYHSEGEAMITSSESLQNIDVHTDLYLFPVAVNALYQFKQIKRITAYVGGGLGFCMAVRDSNSTAIKETYYSGPDYRATLNHSQTITGLLVNLMAGVSIPVHDRLKFIAEASTTLYDLKAFDPILEISFTKENPDWYPYSDLSQWSYEDPLKIGVFKEVYVTNISAGFVMPF